VNDLRYWFGADIRSLVLPNMFEDGPTVLRRPADIFDREPRGCDAAVSIEERSLVACVPVLSLVVEEGRNGFGCFVNRRHGRLFWRERALTVHGCARNTSEIRTAHIARRAVASIGFAP